MVHVSYRGKQYQFNVVDQMTIGQLKQEIENQLHVARETQKLVGDGQVMEDDHILTDSETEPSFLLFGTYSSVKEDAIDSFKIQEH